ncbi:MAG: hypothetical protein JXA92_09865 [candidate division Zixibacteria bacterium]|nr:hypothetical protein [candidate division Zixibacteria bacterium]
MRIFYSALSLLILMTIVFSCGQKEDINAARNFLPAFIEGTGVERASEIRIFRGESLWEYIDGGAELYHDYNFVEVATADYKTGEVEFVVDIYRFDTSLNAYGLYTNFRPPSPDTVRLGVEGYQSPASLNFVKGDYLIRLTGFDETEQTDNALAATARAIEKIIPGPTDRPEMFRRFYFVDKIKYTDKYLTKSFLGRSYLTEFYTQDYLINGDTVTMFLAMDTGEVKCNRWVEDLRSDTNFFEAPRGLITVNGRMFTYKDPYYNVVMSIYDSGILFGILDAKLEHKDIMVQWVMSMPGFNADSSQARIKRITDSTGT